MSGLKGEKELPLYFLTDVVENTRCELNQDTEFPPFDVVSGSEHRVGDEPWWTGPPVIIMVCQIGWTDLSTYWVEHLYKMVMNLRGAQLGEFHEQSGHLKHNWSSKQQLHEYAFNWLRFNFTIFGEDFLQGWPASHYKGVHRFREFVYFDRLHVSMPWAISKVTPGAGPWVYLQEDSFGVCI